MSLNIGIIALFTGLTGLLWTIVESFVLKKQKPFSLFVFFIKNWIAFFFVFSAVVKLVDPVGFSIKITDYFSEFNLNALKPFSQLISFVVLVLEFALGITLLFNIWKRLTLFLLLGMILFFTLLTGVSAIFEVVQDCGCFGDFLKISPWTSFIKDIVLTILIVFVFLNIKLLNPWFKPKGSWAIAGLGIFAALAFTLHNYFHLPIWDFRAYKIGTYIPEGMQEIKAPVVSNSFTYKNISTGEEQVFVNDFPDDLNAWEFVSRESEVLAPGIPAPIHDFSLSTFEGEDWTELILSYEKPIVLLTVLDTRKAKDKGIEKFKSIISYSDETNEYGYAFLTAATESDLTEYKAKHNFAGNNLSIDGTTLKTMIRSNPGLILLEQGTIKGKWHYRDIPKPEKLLQ